MIEEAKTFNLKTCICRKQKELVTLWAISGKFLKEPWKWPQLWQMNREQIKNPHLIYPGDILRLDRSGISPSLSLVGGTGAAVAEGNVVRLQPRTRTEPLSTAVPTIPGSAIGPFLTQPLVLNEGEADTYPYIVATEEERVIIGAGNLAYVAGLKSGDPVNWQVFRPGEALNDPETGEFLGYEALYIADAVRSRGGWHKDIGPHSTVGLPHLRSVLNRMNHFNTRMS